MQNAKCKIGLPPRGGSALAVEELAKVTNFTHSPFVFCFAKSTCLACGLGHLSKRKIGAIRESPLLVYTIFDTFNHFSGISL